MIAKIAYHYLENWADSEDIVQDVFIRWIKKHPKFDSSEYEKAWFIRVTMNLCKDRLRSFWLKKTIVTTNETTLEFPIGIPSMQEDAEHVLQQVRSLPEKYRIVVYLHYYEGYTLKEIARILKKNEHTIQTWHQRAKVLLKPRLEVVCHEYGLIQKGS